MKHGSTTRSSFFRCLSSLLFVALVTGCGSSGSDSSPTQSAPSGYRVGLKAATDPLNFYPYLTDIDGVCLAPGDLTSSCNTNDSRRVSQLSTGSGFVGFPYGLKGFTRDDLDLDPEVAESISIYSGAAATYTAKHSPVAVEHSGFTYFVFSGPASLDGQDTVLSTDNNGSVTTSDSFLRDSDKKSNALGIYVARFNRLTKKVSAPLLVHVKNTDDPHDNAVLNFDDEGNLYVLISGRSLLRSALLYFIEKPSSVALFDSSQLTLKDISPENINYSSLGFNKISTPEFASITYPKLLKINDGFRLIYNIYCLNGGNSSCNGTRQLWSAKLTYDPNVSDLAEMEQVQPLAAIGGHYAVATVADNGRDIAVAFNYLHRESAADRTNLYVLTSRDGGETWSSLSPFSGEQTALDDVLPIGSFRDLEQANAVKLYPGNGNVVHRIYVKDVIFRPQSGNLLPVVLYVGSTGRFSHNPTLQPIHYLGVAEHNGRGWEVKSVSREIDHNYSSGFLYFDAQQKLHSLFPGTPLGNRNGLAGGAFAHLPLDDGGALTYLNELRQVGQPGYLNGLCEVNYLRGVQDHNTGGIVGIGSAANPYQFESGSSNENLPASPLFLIDESNAVYRLPMILQNADENGEYALTTLSQQGPLNCQSSS